MIRVVHVITGLQVGGAELALLRLLEATDRSRVKPSVVSLTAGGEVALRVADLGVSVHNLAVRGPAGLPLAVARLRQLLRHGSADVVQTWMHHADLVGGLAAKASGLPVVWGLRMGNLHAERAMTRAVARVNAALARRVPAAIVACSASVAEEHVRRGYPRERITVIPNGYGPGGRSPQARAQLRRELAIPDDALVVGRVGRWHVMKDYPGFLKSAAPLLETMPALHLVLVGDGVDHDNATLQGLVGDLAEPHRVHLLGRRDDMAAVYSALDVLCSSSASGEGFPNVVAEAMLAEVPVVTTDVGESAQIVGEAGRIVPPSRPDLLNRALEELLALPPADRRELGARGAASIRDRYGLAQMAAAYADIHARVSSSSAG